jgi:hypothetical protein
MVRRGSPVRVRKRASLDESSRKFGARGPRSESVLDIPETLREEIE